MVTADGCSEKGLVVPPIPQEIVDTIGGSLPPFWSRANPLDLVGTRDPDTPLLAVEELLKWDGIDAVISMGVVGRFELARLWAQSTHEADPSAPPGFLGQIEEFSKQHEKRFITRLVELMEAYRKPVVGVSLTKTDEGTVRRVPGRQYSGVFYQTPESAVNVLARMAAYHGFITSQG